MGLDMWLYSNRKKTAAAAQKATGSDRYLARSDLAVYWRKANAVHGWFVRNLFKDNDDSYCLASVDDLVALKKDCNAVLQDASLAEELLPTTPGFFFGSMDYDEKYFNELRRTVAGIDAILDNVEEYTYDSFAGKLLGWREKGETRDLEVIFRYVASW